MDGTQAQGPRALRVLLPSDVNPRISRILMFDACCTVQHRCMADISRLSLEKLQGY